MMNPRIPPITFTFVEFEVFKSFAGKLRISIGVHAFVTVVAAYSDT